MGGSPPLGYDVRDRKLVVNPAEAELVRLIFRRFLDLGSALLLIRELNAQGHRTKSWTTQAGTFREGRPFDKGTLYKILRNRTYIGEAVHKGQSYPGEHEPIVDRATWDRVHEVLASNARRRGNEARARTPAPLRGLMRCTHCSSAMTPTHTRRRGRLYRYYVCLGASRRGHDTCPVRSIAASEVEGLVLGQVRRLLASPELVARTITAVRRENGAAENPSWPCCNHWLILVLLGQGPSIGENHQPRRRPQDNPIRSGHELLTEHEDTSSLGSTSVPGSCLARPEHAFQGVLELLSVGSSPCVEDHQIDGDPLQSPVLVRPQELPHDSLLFLSRYPDQSDG